MEAAVAEFLRTTDLSKIEANIGEALIHSPTSRFCVLLLSGSFNPIHLMHVDMFEIAKDHLEQNLGYRVVGGLVAPSSDHYVSGKLGAEAMSLHHRCLLVQAATADSTWVSVCGFGCASSSMSAEVATAALAQSLPGVNIEVREICGGDHINRYRRWDRPFVCIARRGYSQSIEHAVRHPGSHKVHPGFVFIQNDDRMRDYSSSAIREALNGLNDGSLQDITTLDLPIHPEVAALMQQYGGRMLLVNRPGPNKYAGRTVV